MIQFRKDLKDLLESISGVKSYPITIPNGAKYPCLIFNLSGGGRDGDSSLTGTQLKNIRLSVTISGNSSKDLYPIEELLTEALDGKPLPLESTLIAYLDNSVEIYNHVQGLRELTVDFSIKRIK